MAFGVCTVEKKRKKKKEAKPLPTGLSRKYVHDPLQGMGLRKSICESPTMVTQPM